jgi:hypothetical protein
MYKAPFCKRLIVCRLQIIILIYLLFIFCNRPAGEWRCRIQPASGGLYQEGAIHLLTSQQGFVRDMRLPRHVVPSAYSLVLTPFIVPDNYTIAGSVNITAKIMAAENKCNYKARRRSY